MVYMVSHFCKGEVTAAALAVEKCRFFLLGLSNFTLCIHPRPLIKIFLSTPELGDISNPRLYNQKIRLLPYRFTPFFSPDKEHITLDCWSRRRDFPAPAPPPAPIDLLKIENLDTLYSSTLGPPSWVSKPGASLAFLTSKPIHLHSTTEKEALGQAEEQLACQGRDSLSAEDTEVAGLQQSPVLLVTWERLQAVSAYSPHCRQLVELLQSGLPEEMGGWPYHFFRSNLIAADRAILSSDRPLIPP